MGGPGPRGFGRERERVWRVALATLYSYIPILREIRTELERKKHVRVGQGHLVRVCTVLCAGRVILNFSSIQVTK